MEQQKHLFMNLNTGQTYEGPPTNWMLRGSKPKCSDLTDKEWDRLKEVLNAGLSGENDDSTSLDV